LLIAFLCLMALSLGCNSRSSTNSGTSPGTSTATRTPAAAAPPIGGFVQNTPPEVTLASIQKRTQVDANDPLVKQFSVQLDALGKKCPELTRGALAENVNSTNQSITSSGVAETPLDTITRLNAAVPSDAHEPCARAFASYAASRVKGP
jgi:hypothetical protein